MQTPAQIAFHGFEPSEALKLLIDHRLVQLEKVHPRITTARVVVELPHRHHHTGNVWHVKLMVDVPGAEIVVNRETEKGERHKDPGPAIRDAFDAARRQLLDHARRNSHGHAPAHAEPETARVIAVGGDHGFLATAEGRQLYFHANAVLDHRFDDLTPGTPVTYVEEDGIEGPQASTVRVLR